MTRDALTLVRELYEAINRADADAIFSLLAPNIEWITPSGLPWTLPGSDGIYRGHSELVQYFTHCVSQVEEMRVDVTDLLPAGPRILGLGYECGRARSTGREFRTRFAQLWTVDDSLITRLEGFPDTASMQEAFRPEA